MANMGFYFNMSICIGCRTCQVACKDKNNLQPGTIFRQVRTFETGSFPKVGLYHYSATCNHCAEAKCVKGCPTGALHFADDGTVQHDKNKCIGCQYCTWNCPYSVPQFIEAAGIIGKCDSCKDLRDKGENPACVDACLMRCLEFGDLDELTADHGPKLVRDLPILPTSSMTNPSLLITPRSHALDPNVQEKEV
ncbi:anaerobic dimethyl sulfoxide reductase subunit B (iron-sulfur subunit) [Desulfitobacterium sp. LBE]|uniref:4Fe-4S ferredoxin iron-sulfur binding domain protein n=1 Tax=Desulfitobacterium hafniense (strain DSM 10664 / DCB-2) TaxID=272564 RepID=B8FTD4_DESHD|nr:MULTISPECIES: 4Fe-4S dicluster domain-containing protein [Desulfitobacterium]ACL20368.1 4Fe-4S ferredoxin iron-sulfur binding domain protein [Desulfitobacterium hafniense DCB-2]TWH56772.1 anaerobic dimethyl sulfoxide reductase subunit B (iron-sulfur subunit) [Desulfitobacterium sp. LBE]